MFMQPTFSEVPHAGQHIGLVRKQNDYPMDLDKFISNLTPEQKKVYDVVVRDLLHEFKNESENQSCKNSNIVFRKPRSWKALSEQIESVAIKDSDLPWKEQLVGYVATMILHGNKINELYQTMNGLSGKITMMEQKSGLSEMEKNLRDVETDKIKNQKEITNKAIQTLIEQKVNRLLTQFTEHLSNKRPQEFDRIAGYVLHNLDSLMLFSCWNDVSPTQDLWKDDKLKGFSNPKKLFHVRVGVNDEKFPDSIVQRFKIEVIEVEIEGSSLKTRRIEIKENSPFPSGNQPKSKKDSVPSLQLTEETPRSRVSDAEYTFMYNFALCAIEEANEKLGFAPNPNLSKSLSTMRKSPIKEFK